MKKFYAMTSRRSIKAIADKHGIPFERVEFRRSGRTTAQAFLAIGKAMSNPGTIVFLHDHSSSKLGDELLVDQAYNIIEDLELKGFAISTPNRTITYDPEW